MRSVRRHYFPEVLQVEMWTNMRLKSFYGAQEPLASPMKAEHVDGKFLEMFKKQKSFPVAT